jgi:hypothetical protein
MTDEHPSSQPGQGNAVQPPDADDRMLRAINDGIDFVMEHLCLSDRDADLANVIGNAIGTAWNRQEPPATWAEFIGENWSADPGEKEDPATWWDW